MFKHVEGRKRKGNRHMKSGFVNKRHNLSCQSKQQKISGTGKHGQELIQQVTMGISC